ncbi:unnamed protein product [Adineta steineri]|uniref:Uncharacterized protein n=1 Tax=Adineta steineri TaxID=433720 RepID=A0A818SN29_9BILA|nr:unnamed protein product [Adineta steineri]CAF3672312.1 unnamed protein product [Adineta steineri]
MTSAFGYIIEFNKQTNYGYIQKHDDESNKQIFLFHLGSLEKTSKKYINKGDSTFLGKLFDFHIIKRNGGLEDEAVNIRHHVLKYPIPQSSQLETLTNKEVSNDNIKSESSTIINLTETSSQEVINSQNKSRIVTQKLLQEQRRKMVNKFVKAQLFVVNLPAHSKSALGRFIGKKGVHLKSFERENNVSITILPKSKSYSSIQNSDVKVQLKSYNHDIDVELVSRKLKVAWETAVVEQKQHEETIRQTRLQGKQKNAGKQTLRFRAIEFESDARHERTLSVSPAKLRQRRTGIMLKKQRERYSSEGHRCAATYNLQSREERTTIIHQKKKTNMKDKQWLVREQLYNM